jgi:hypothetical protein
MEQQERIHRPDPERTEPIRDSAGYIFNATTGGSGPKLNPEPKKSAGAADDVAYGVKLGYQVIEEQILEGQRLAQRLRQAANLKGVTNSEDISPLVGRVLHVYKELGAVCFEAVEALLRSPALRVALSRMWQDNAQSGPEHDSDSDTICAVEIASSRPIQVTLKLSRGPQTSLPLVHALHAHDASIPSLTKVRFTLEPANQLPMLHVNIPDTQPPATYTGVVVDGATNEPCGTLCIRLLP